MGFSQIFREIGKDAVHDLAVERKAQGWRFSQVLATRTIDGIDLTYSYLKDGVLENDQVINVQPDDHIESVSDSFFNAFVFENEAHDLYGVHIDNIAIDFKGAFYDLAIKEPMTILSPAQKAAREAAVKGGE